VPAWRRVRRSRDDAVGRHRAKVSPKVLRAVAPEITEDRLRQKINPPRRRKNRGVPDQDRSAQPCASPTLAAL